MRKNETYTGFEIEDGVVVSYVDGKKQYSQVPSHARFIFYYYLNYIDNKNRPVVVNTEFIETILDLSSLVIYQELVINDEVMIEYGDLPDMCEYTPDILGKLNSWDLAPLKISEALIRKILEVVDLVVVESMISEKQSQMSGANS